MSNKESFPASSRILVVDDLKSIRTIMSDILKKNGYLDVEQAEDGYEAFKKMKAAASSMTPFDLVICDWNMPRMSGVELLKAKNEDADLRSSVFIMVTIESERAYVLKAISLGIDEFVVKPFSEETVLNKVSLAYKKHLAKKR